MHLKTCAKMELFYTQKIKTSNAEGHNNEKSILAQKYCINLTDFHRFK